MAQELQINIGDYLKDKESGAAKVFKLNGAPYYSLRTFDRFTGVQSAPLNVPMTTESIKDLINGWEKELAKRNEDLAAARQFLSDLETAPELLNP